MKAAGKTKKKKSIVLRVALIAFSVYVLVVLVQLQRGVSERQKKSDQLQADIVRLTKENEALQNQNENWEQYVERIARDQGYGLPGETYYIEIPGK